MIHIVVNGLLIEAQSITEVHFQAEIKKHYIPCAEFTPYRRKISEEKSILTDLMREVFNEMLQTKERSK